VIADGITEQSKEQVSFLSKTTGDSDGIDLSLDDAPNGVLHFTSEAGNQSVHLSELTQENPKQFFDFGGVDMRLIIEHLNGRM